MHEMNAQFAPESIEADIFKRWNDAGYFKCDVKDAQSAELEPYVVVIPPPNVTGVLHMGHALNDTIQDALVRRKRMMGHPTLWVLGTDHAGIATQNKVEQKLAKQGKTREDVGREAFIDLCWEWRAEHGSAIVEQIKRIGCSCDYSQEWFTMDEHYQRAVRETFVDWWDAGHIYRGNRIINWCPRCQTTLADDEVEHEDQHGHLWHIRYPLAETEGGITHITIATTRPETMLGDVAIAVNPKDERYSSLVGKKAILPLIGRELDIIADDYVDMSFGSGAVKITPAHDINDFEIGLRHNLEQVNVMDEEAIINELGGAYAGMARYEAREQIVKDLSEQGLLVEVEDHDHAVGHCYRCDTIVEPWLSEQWFVNMQELVKEPIEAVRDGRVTFHPKRHERSFFSWNENIRNWAVSRQLWWGHRIPVFYCDDCGEMLASKVDITECAQCGGAVRQDEDVLDTWFSSQLWPFAVFGWPDNTAELETFYPTSVLSTARDIINLWVSRMMVSGMYFLDGKVPFHDVIIHPTILDKHGARMSKSKGNGVDPIDLIETFGADAMRFGLLSLVTSSQDIKFDKDKLSVFRNFANKIWNASRFVLMNSEGYSAQAPEPKTVADRWILSRLAQLSASVDAGMENFDFSDTMRALYDFFWSEYCNWYIELSKAQLNGSESERASAQSVLNYVLDQSLRLLHPVMPFITEEIWQKLAKAEGEADSLMVAEWPKASVLSSYIDEDAERTVESLQAIVSALRSVRARYGLSPKQELAAEVRVSEPVLIAALEAESDFISSLANISTLKLGEDISKPEASVAIIDKGLEIFVVLGDLVDMGAERAKLERQKEKLVADFAKFDKKLSNPGFLAKASPEIIEKDRAAHAELATQIEAFDRQIAELS